MDEFDALFAIKGDDMTTIVISKSAKSDERTEKLLREPQKYLAEALRRAEEDVRAEIDLRHERTRRS
jgi:hypothetical protein